MPSIKLGSQVKNNAVYIHSINKKFQNKIKYELKRFKTSPERSNFSISPDITKVFGRAQILQHQQSVILEQKMGYKLVELKNKGWQEKPKKRWNSIQKEQYNHIKNQINNHKLQTPSNATINHRAFPTQLLNKIQLSRNLTPQTQTINPFHQVREQWFANKLRHHFKPKFFTQTPERQLQHSPPIEKESPTKPFNFSLKLPKLQQKNQPQKNLLKTIQISQQANEGEQQIFCNRKIKKSLRNLQSQKGADFGQSSKLGELALAVKRRRVKTIDYQQAPQTVIAPWNVNNATKSLFY